MLRPPPGPSLFPYTTLFRSEAGYLHRKHGTGTFVNRVPTRHALESTLSYTEMIASAGRSEEHTSELQSRRDLVCRLLLEKKKTRPRAREISGVRPAKAAYAH